MEAVAASSPSVAPVGAPPAVAQSASASEAQPGGANGSDAAKPSFARGVHITEGAAKYAKERLAQRGTPNAAVRLGIKGGGCSGFSYVIEFSDDAPRERDTVAEYHGVRFYVDKKSLVYLAGSTLDYVKSLMFSGFQFLNPQEAAKCGCGHSFTVK